MLWHAGKRHSYPAVVRWATVGVEDGRAIGLGGDRSNEMDDFAVRVAAADPLLRHQRVLAPSRRWALRPPDATPDGPPQGRSLIQRRFGGEQRAQRATDKRGRLRGGGYAAEDLSLARRNDARLRRESARHTAAAGV